MKWRNFSATRRIISSSPSVRYRSAGRCVDLKICLTACQISVCMWLMVNDSLEWRPRAQIPSQREIEKWNCESLENKPGPNVLQCHYRITLPSDADYTCTGCIFCARHRDRLVPLEKPIRRGVLITQCIRKLLMGNCTPGALFATFRRRIEEWPSGERDGCKSNWAWLIECRGTDYYIVVCIYAV